MADILYGYTREVPDLYICIHSPWFLVNLHPTITVCLQNPQLIPNQIHFAKSKPSCHYSLAYRTHTKAGRRRAPPRTRTLHHLTSTNNTHYAAPPEAHKVLFFLNPWGIIINGFHTWLTAGGIVAISKSWVSFLMPKLLTPIDFANPNLWHSSIASHLPFMSKGITSSFDILLLKSLSASGFNLNWTMDQIEIYILHPKLPKHLK